MKDPGRFARSQRTTIVNGILLVVITLVMLQLWLFTASMNAYLGGDCATAAPAAVVSLVCLALNAGLLRYAWRFE